LLVEVLKTRPGGTPWTNCSGALELFSNRGEHRANVLPFLFGRHLGIVREILWIQASSHASEPVARLGSVAERNDPNPTSVEVVMSGLGMEGGGHLFTGFGRDVVEALEIDEVVEDAARVKEEGRVITKVEVLGDHRSEAGGVNEELSAIGEFLHNGAFSSLSLDLHIVWVVEVEGGDGFVLLSDDSVFDGGLEEIVIKSLTEMMLIWTNDSPCKTSELGGLLWIVFLSLFVSDETETELDATKVADSSNSSSETAIVEKFRNFVAIR